jgi:RimJ/RimL family protein N-acetyltransferase
VSGSPGQRPLPELREAREEDLPFILATERLPGYDALVGRWSEAEHRAALAEPSVRYLLAVWPGESPGGFAVLTGFGDAHEGVKLKRIAVAAPGRGLGTVFTRAVVDWVFSSTDTPRLWLDVFAHNERAVHVYRSVGMRTDGILRRAYLLPGGDRVDRLLMSMLRDEWRAA